MTEVGAATEQRIASVPTLDDIARDPGCAGGLPARALAALQSRAAVVQAALAAEALAMAIERPEAHGQPSQTPAGDRTLNADQIAEQLGQTRRWVFRNVCKLPFVRRISRKALAGSEAGLRRWRDSQKA